MPQATAPFDLDGPHAEPPYHEDDGVACSRIRVDKTFHGDLEGRSSVDMLSVGDPGSGSAGYVGLERVSASSRAGGGRSRCCTWPP